MGIIGYPCNRSREARRQKSSGIIEEIEGHVLNHSIPTKKGFSGSPLLVKEEGGSWIAVAIHTHRVDNSLGVGIYFTPQLVNLVKSLESQLRQTYSLKDRITYNVKDIHAKPRIHSKQRRSVYEQ